MLSGVRGEDEYAGGRMTAFPIIAACCAVVIATSMIWPGRSPDEQIAPELFKLLAWVVLVVDVLVWLIVLAARR